MQTADFDHNDFDANKQGDADAKLMVKFYTKSVPDSAATVTEGRPMFKDMEVIDIRVPGSRDGVARPVTERDKNRFPRHYAAYQARIEMPVEGTPLNEWPAVSRSFAEQLSFENIKTVEQLADLNESLMHKIPGVQNFKQKAKDWLAATQDDKLLANMRDELTERDNKIEELAGQMEDLIAQVAELKSKPTRRKKAE